MQPSKELLKRDRVGDVPAQHRLMALVAHGHCLAVIGALEETRVAPGIAKVVLAARAERGRDLFAIDEEFLVPLSPPAAARIPDVQHDAAEPPAALRTEHHPIRPAILGQGVNVAMPLAVKIAQTLKRPIQRRMRDLETKTPGHGILVHELQPRALGERHVPEGISALLRHARRQGLVEIHTGAPCRRSRPAGTRRPAAVRRPR